MHTIQVTVIKAILTHNTDIAKSMDPYCKLTIGQQSYRTAVLYNKGDMPEWNELFQFRMQGSKIDDLLDVKLFDKDNLKKDDLIGEVLIKISEQNMQSTNSASTIRQWYSLKYNKKPAGKVMLKISTSSQQFGYTDFGSKINSQIQYRYSTPVKLNEASQIRSLSRSSSKKHKLTLSSQLKQQKMLVDKGMNLISSAKIVKKSILTPIQWKKDPTETGYC